ncbi:MAG: Ku protein, partial [Terracoccus sp.]
HDLGEGYLEPDKTGLKPYILLRDALEKADRMALVTVAVRTRMTLAVLRVRDGVIVLQTLLWADEVRTPEFESLDEDTHATAKELAMASSLVDSLSGDYEPDEFEDDYAEAVTVLVATKIEGGEITETPEAKSDDSEVIDLLAALQRSVDKAKAGKAARADSAGPAPTAESASGGEAKTTKKAAKKSTTEKVAQKSTTKKSAAKKSA